MTAWRWAPQYFRSLSGGEGNYNWHLLSHMRTMHKYDEILQCNFQQKVFHCRPAYLPVTCSNYKKNVEYVLLLKDIPSANPHLTVQRRIQGGCRGCPDTRPLLRVPFLKIYCGPIWRNLHFPVPVDYRSSIASKIDATHVIKAHSIIQFVMPWNAGKMNHEVSRFSNFLGEAPRPPAGARLRRAYRGFAPSGAPFWWIGHPPLPNPRSATAVCSQYTPTEAVSQI